MINPNRRVYIESVVVDIKEYLKVKKVVDLKELKRILKKLKGKMIFSEDVGEDGVIVKTNSKPYKFYIVINKRYKNDRSLNCKIAYQIGNFFLNLGYLTDRKLWEQPWVETDFKNYFELKFFAQTLLMEEKLFIEKYNGLKLHGEINYEKLSDFFKVEVEKIKSREINLGLKW
jgi:hypothetical protein